MLFRSFRGNSEDYYDPRNSFLNDVMDRRCGIPIMLSTIYLEMAARLNFPLAGVGMPGHYLVRHRYFDIFIDPFEKGQVLTIEQCQERMHKALGHELPFERELLEPAPKLRTVMRMLNNLRNVYAATRQFTRALRITELALALNPETEGEWEVVLASDLRQRAGLLMELRRYSQALATLERYLELDPKADDALKRMLEPAQVMLGGSNPWDIQVRDPLFAQRVAQELVGGGVSRLAQRLEAQHAAVPHGDQQAAGHFCKVRGEVRIGSLGGRRAYS